MVVPRSTLPLLQWLKLFIRTVPPRVGACRFRTVHTFDRLLVLYPADYDRTVLYCIDHNHLAGA